MIRRPGASGDDVLDEALTRLERKVGKKPQDAVPSLTKGLRARLYDRLTERGIVEAKRDKVFGLLHRTRWPAADSEHERRVRTQLTDLLVHQIAADARTAALVSLVSAVDAVPKIVDPRDAGVDKRELKKRAKAIAEGQCQRPYASRSQTPEVPRER